MWFSSQQPFVGRSIAWRQKERLWSWLCLWQIGDNVTCPWEICGDAKYTFQDPFNHQRSSNTISSPDLYPVISHYLSLVACGVWWEGGKWGRQMTVFLSFPFPSSPAPAVRYVRRLPGAKPGFFQRYAQFSKWLCPPPSQKKNNCVVSLRVFSAYEMTLATCKILCRLFGPIDWCTSIIYHTIRLHTFPDSSGIRTILLLGSFCRF